MAEATIASVSAAASDILSLLGAIMTKPFNGPIAMQQAELGV
jgi:hypothetical protein